MDEVVRVMSAMYTLVSGYDVPLHLDDSFLTGIVVFVHINIIALIIQTYDCYQLFGFNLYAEK